MKNIEKTCKKPKERLEFQIKLSGYATELIIRSYNKNSRDLQTQNLTMSKICVLCALIFVSGHKHCIAIKCKKGLLGNIWQKI